MTLAFMWPAGKRMQEMAVADELRSALEEALAAACHEYRHAVLELAGVEAAKNGASARKLADVEHIHQARTRLIALEAAREELSRTLDESAPLSA